MESPKPVKKRQKSGESDEKANIEGNPEKSTTEAEDRKKRSNIVTIKTLYNHLKAEKERQKMTSSKCT